jgi:hypothetical protein
LVDPSIVLFRFRLPPIQPAPTVGDRRHRASADIKPPRDLPLRERSFLKQSFDLFHQSKSKHGILGG